jgi:hypothetical protein
MKIFLSCRKAYERLKGRFRIYTAPKRLVIYIPSGVHVGAKGRTIDMDTLVDILCNGNEHIPKRDFKSDAQKQLRKDLIRLLKNKVKINKQNRNNSNDLGTVILDFESEELTAEVTSLVKQWLFSGVYYKRVAPNAPKTIQNKGSDVPLVETGMLVNSITAKIRE